MAICLDELEYYTLRYCGSPPPIKRSENWEALTQEVDPEYTVKAKLRIWAGGYRGESIIDQIFKKPSFILKVLKQSPQERLINKLHKIAFEGEDQ